MIGLICAEAVLEVNTFFFQGYASVASFISRFSSHCLIVDFALHSVISHHICLFSSLPSA